MRVFLLLLAPQSFYAHFIDSIQSLEIWGPDKVVAFSGGRMRGGERREETVVLLLFYNLERHFCGSTETGGSKKGIIKRNQT